MITSAGGVGDDTEAVEIGAKSAVAREELSELKVGHDKVFVDVSCPGEEEFHGLVCALLVLDFKLIFGPFSRHSSHKVLIVGLETGQIV